MNIKFIFYILMYVCGEEISLKSASIVLNILYEYMYEPGTREKLTHNMRYGKCLKEESNKQ